MTEITFDVSESHANRFEELCETMDVDAEAEFADLLMQSIDETYRNQLRQNGSDR
jgi:hypothetical protein